VNFSIEEWYYISDATLLIVAVLALFAWVPQIKKVKKTKKVGDISISREVMFLLANFLMLNYGISAFLYNGSFGVLAEAILNTVLSSYLLFLILKYRKPDTELNNQ
jgi:uncharacterized protein with PQ loop repeat